ncbi:hypothetical protein N7478_005623 [Penicillium angulare]|uniref:uncharacterized protein n=1 Tax=Penicillium angulare TaxID=116970 RepID=UPI0025425831|nr:uncharacterized protein N7478_005623 [Penicillium angulare]KAJ5280251.1 hypothetical protein N7478_005623 [Penicillium angulare]
MANAGYTSPFPTSHDTIGQSTLVTPLYMPSSPPANHETSPTPPDSPLRAESPISDHFGPEDDDDDEIEPEHHNNDKQGPEDEIHRLSHHSAPGSPTGSDLDARLANYTLDFSQFPSGNFADGQDEIPLPDMKNDIEDGLSDVGGPEDFTANMEKYLMGEGMSSTRKSRTNEANTSLRHSSLRSRQPVVEEEADSVEYSEFGPPVDMSTPSHVLHRTSALAKDSTQLEDIEEDPADGLPSPESPSSRRMSNGWRDQAEEREERLQERMAQLEKELHDRDEQLLKNRSRILEAASASEQIRHLQAELQLKNEHIAAIEIQSGEQAVLLERIQTLEKQADERENLLRQSASAATPTDIAPLEQKIRDMQQQLKNQESQSSLDAERLETISHLRQQLNLTQEQLKKRDATMDETLAKLKDVTHAKEVHLREKNDEIERLKSDLDDMALENEKLETELDNANTDYEALEDRLTNLETKNQPLEERNQSLEADLTRVQSQVEAQESALKSMAADLPFGSRSTYSEILDLIKDLGPPESEVEPESPTQEKFSASSDVQQLRDEMKKFQQEVQDASSAQRAAEVEANCLREQATEMQNLIKTIESENLRLTARVQELTTTLNQTQHDLTRTQEEHAESLETIARLQEDALGQPPSTPPSPPKAHGALSAEQNNAPDTAALEKAHQAQIMSLQTAHSTAVSTLRSSHAESMRKIRNSLTTAEQREAELRVELTTLRTSVNTQDTQLRRSFKSEIKRLEAVIAAKDETAAAIDQRISLSVDKREREWERRVDLLLKERDRMAKALMMYWGEKEMGRGPGAFAEGKENRDGKKETKQGQAYKYKYSQKHRSKSRESRERKA